MTHLLFYSFRQTIRYMIIFYLPIQILLNSEHKGSPLRSLTDFVQTVREDLKNKPKMAYSRNAFIRDS